MAIRVGDNQPNTLIGTPNTDDIVGRGGADRLVGKGGDDVISGGGGNDSGDNRGLFGGGGDDILSGGIGNDLLRGGNGDDTFAGGNGNDTFFDSVDDDNDAASSTSFDTIVDFRSGDVIDVDLNLAQLNAIAASGGGTAGANAVIGEGDDGVFVIDQFFDQADVVSIDFFNAPGPGDDLLTVIGTDELTPGTDIV